MSLKVSHRGVYCSHGDAPEGAVLEDKFLDIEDQNGDKRVTTDIDLDF